MRARGSRCARAIIDIVRLARADIICTMTHVGQHPPRVSVGPQRLELPLAMKSIGRKKFATSRCARVHPAVRDSVCFRPPGDFGFNSSTRSLARTHIRVHTVRRIESYRDRAASRSRPSQRVFRRNQPRRTGNVTRQRRRIDRKVRNCSVCIYCRRRQHTRRCYLESPSVHVAVARSIIRSMHLRDARELDSR